MPTTISSNLITVASISESTYRNISLSQALNFIWQQKIGRINNVVPNVSGVVSLNLYNLADINQNVSGATNGQILSFNSTSSKWEASNLTIPQTISISSGTLALRPLSPIVTTIYIIENDLSNNGRTFVWNINSSTPSWLEVLPKYTFDDLTNVSVSGAVRGDSIVFNGTEWVPQPSGLNTLDGLNDVSTSGAIIGNTIMFNGTSWVASGTDAPSLATLTDTSGVNTALAGDILYFNGTKWIPSRSDLNQKLDDLFDVTVSGAVVNDILKFNGTEWVPSVSGSVALSTLTDTSGVNSASYGDVLSFDGSKWVPVHSDINQVLEDLANVASGAVANDFLKFDGTNWIPSASGTQYFSSLGDVNVTGVVPGNTILFDGAKWVPAVSGIPSLSSLTDVNVTGINVGDSISFDGSKWVPAPPVATPLLSTLPDVVVSGVAVGDNIVFDGTNWVPSASGVHVLKAGDTITGDIIIDSSNIDLKGSVNTISGTINSSGVEFINETDSLFHYKNINTSSEIFLDKNDFVVPFHDTLSLKPTGIVLDEVIQGSSHIDIGETAKGNISLTVNGTASIPTLDEQVTTKKYVDDLIKNQKLEDHLDTVLSGVNSGDTLVFNGTSWVPQASGASDTSVYTGEPTGFPIDSTGAIDRSSSVISFDNSTRTFTIAPTSTSFDVIIKGKKVTKTSESITIPNSTGTYHIYFDEDGVIQYLPAFSLEIIYKYVYLANVYWSATQSKAIIFGDERHGSTMDSHTHAHLHTSIGAVYIGGCGLNTFSVDGNGSLDSQAQFGIETGLIRDEDILHSLPVVNSTTPIPVLYRIGGEWQSELGSFNFKQGSNGRAQYNSGTPGSYTLTEISSGSYTLTHVVATNDPTQPFIALMGLNQYSNRLQAREGAMSEIGQYTDLPFMEFVFIGTVILQSSNTFSNSAKTVIVSTDLGGNYVDWRFSESMNPVAALQEAASKTYIDSKFAGEISGGTSDYLRAPQLNISGTLDNSFINLKLDDLSDVVSSGAVNGNTIVFNGTNWTPSTTPISTGLFVNRPSTGLVNGQIYVVSGETTAANRYLNGRAYVYSLSGAAWYELATYGRESSNNIRYVSNYGSDTNNNGTVTSPYVTIARAISDLTTTGGTIYLYPGVYSGNVTITNALISIIGMTSGNTHNAMLVSIYGVLRLSGASIFRCRFENLHIAPNNVADKVPLLITSSSSQYEFKNVRFSPQDSVANCVTISSNPTDYINFLDCEFTGAGIVELNAPSLTTQGHVYFERAKSLKNLYVRSAFLRVTVRDSVGVGLTHEAGRVRFSNCQNINPFVSTAPADVNNSLYIENSSTYDFSTNTYGIINKTGTCTYTFKDFDVPRLGNTINGTETVSPNGNRFIKLNEIRDVDLVTSGAVAGNTLVFNGTNWIPSVSGATMLRQLTDVTSGSVSGNTLVFNGTNWIPAPSGATALRQLTDVTSGATNGQTLVFNGTNWIPTTPTSSLSGLSDASITSPALGNLLQHDGTRWKNVPDFLGYKSKLFRYTAGNPSFPSGITYGGTNRNVSTEAELNTAISNSVTGDVITLTANITITATVTINKSIKIVGANFTIQTSGTSSDPTVMFSITANNVFLDNGLTIKHLKTTNVMGETVVSLNATGFVSNAKIQFIETAYFLKGSFSIGGTTTYTGVGSNDNIHFLIYKISAPSQINGVVYDFLSEATPRSLFIQVTGLNVTDVFDDILYIANTSQLVTSKVLKQFYIQTQFIKTAGKKHKLWFENNSWNDVSGGIGIALGLNNIQPLDNFEYIALFNNTQGNASVASNNYSGLFYVDGGGLTHSMGTTTWYYGNNSHPTTLKSNFSSSYDNGGIAYKNTTYTAYTAIPVTDSLLYESALTYLSKIGATALSGLSDVDVLSAPPVSGNVLSYNGSNWAPNTPSLDFLSDVDTTTTAPVVNNYLRWNGTNWVPASLPVTFGSSTGTLALRPTSPVSNHIYVVDGDSTTTNNGRTYFYNLATTTWVELDTKVSNRLINELRDVDTVTTAPVVNNILRWDGTNWVPQTANINFLTDVDTVTTAPANGNTLTWNGTNWVPTNQPTIASGLFSARPSSGLVNGQIYIVSGETITTNRHLNGRVYIYSSSATAWQELATNHREIPSPARYVSPWGHDTNNTGSITSPYLTITKAISDLTTNGGTVYLFPGNYQADITITNSIISIIGMTGSNTSNIMYANINGVLRISGSCFRNRIENISITANSSGNKVPVIITSNSGQHEFKNVRMSSFDSLSNSVLINTQMSDYINFIDCEFTGSGIVELNAGSSTTVTNGPISFERAKGLVNLNVKSMFTSVSVKDTIGLGITHEAGEIRLFNCQNINPFVSTATVSSNNGLYVENSSTYNSLTNTYGIVNKSGNSTYTFKNFDIPRSGNTINGAETVSPDGNRFIKFNELRDLDLITTAPVSGNYLRFDGTNWIPAPSGTGTLAGLSDVNVTGAVANNMLIFNGTRWVPQTANINFLTDVDTVTTAPTSGNYLRWNGANWVPTVFPNIPNSIDNLNDVNTSTTPPVVNNILRWDGTNWVPQTANINFLTDVDTVTTAPTNGQSLIWNGTNWTPANVISSLAGLSDVNVTGVSTNNILRWNGSRWVPQTASIDFLTDVDTTATGPSLNNVLTWNGTNWVPRAPIFSQASIGYTSATPPSFTGILPGTIWIEDSTLNQYIYIKDANGNNVWVSLGSNSNSIFLRKDADDTFSGNLTSSSGKFVKLSHASQSTVDDGKIGSGLLGSGLNIIGTQTSAGLGRQIRTYGSLITDTGDKYWNAGNDGSGSGLDADTLDGKHASEFTSIVRSATPPSNPQWGDMWVDTVTGIISMYRKIGSVNDWVEI